MCVGVPDRRLCCGDSGSTALRKLRLAKSDVRRGRRSRTLDSGSGSKSMVKLSHDGSTLEPGSPGYTALPKDVSSLLGLRS